MATRIALPSVPSGLLAFLLLAPFACGPAAPDGPAGEPPRQNNQQVQDRGEGKDAWWQELPRPAWQAFEAIPQSQPWFEVYGVRDGVLAIYEPGQFEEVISYLILGEERALLFDTGLGIGDMARLVDELTALPVTVVNSHSHYDHIGGNHAFEDIRSRATDYTLERARGLPNEAVAEFVGPGWVWKETPSGFDLEDYRIRPFAIAQTLADGDRLDLGNRVLEVLLTPGHAPDSLCLLDRANRLLFTGDTFYLAPLYTHLEGSDFGEYLETSRRLADLAGEVDWLLPAHNQPLAEGRYLLALREAFEAIAAGRESSVLTDGNREYRFEGFSIITR